MAEKTNYKETLNLPRTSFDMRARLLDKEPAILAKWRSEDLYGQIRQARAGAPRYILHDGPPYANNVIHMGQALNKVLKDMVVKYKTMCGLDAPYLPGWDCHGQPIEQKVLDDLGTSADAMEPMEVRRRCFAHAEKYMRLQSEQFQRLGVLGQFDDPYITMQPRYEADVLEVFARLVEQGLVYKQLKPVHWSIENRTALADAELEYHDRQDPSITVSFPLAGGEWSALPRKENDPLALLIWTTTPWTLPANLAVAVHPDLRYAAVHVETGDGPATYLIAEARVQPVLTVVMNERPDWLRSYEVLGSLTGRQILEAKLTYQHPLIRGKDCPVVPADYVTLDEGTGLVHTAPGHGLEDYGTALKCDLEIYCPVHDDGTFDETAPQWLIGRSVWEANGLIVEQLRAAKRLVLDEQITHSYPHDWRSKTPTIFRATEQWFIGVDRPLAGGGGSLRGLAMDCCRRERADGGVGFVPAWGRNRIAGMLESRPDWCISRQRAWGLAIPAFYNEAGRPLLTPNTVRAVAKTIAAEGSDAWFSMTPQRLLGDYDSADDEYLENPEDFPVAKLTGGTDTFDVWFESGSSWYASAIRRGLIEQVPVDLYLEGSDQHRGWFQLSLLLALGAAGAAPFRTVLTHGFVVTEEGYKMSKSLGNAVEVDDQLNQRGADVLRLWVASQNYQDDIRCSDKIIAQAEDTYRKARNTLRFCMGACADFDPARHATEPVEHSVDLWMRMQLHIVIREVREAYERFEFHRAARLLHEFCTVQASSIYLSAVKDRLYCESPDAVRRRASQTVIHEMLAALIKLLGPILPYTAEEAWDAIPNRNAAEPHSVHLALLPEYDQKMLELAEDLRPVNPDVGMFSADELQAGPALIWDRLMALRQAALIKLEALRNAGVKNPLDAEAVFTVAAGNDQAARLIETYLKELEDLLGVGYARIERGGEMPGGATVTVDVFDAREKYPRCARSWKRRPDVGTDPDYPDLSARDAAVMKELSGA